MKLNTSLLKIFRGSLTAAATCLALSLVWVGFSLPTVHAATILAWDPLGTGAASDGSGTWDASTNWWDSSDNQDEAWASGSGAVIGAGVSGAYSITLGSPTSAAGILFTTPGYTVSGSNLTVTLPVTNAAGVTATISNTVALSGQTAVLGSGSVLTLGGGFTSSGNPGFSGAGVTASTYNLTGSVGNSTTAGAMSVYNCTFNQSAGVLSGTGSASDMYVGYHGNGTYNLSGGLITNLGLGISRGSVAILNMTNGGIGANGASGLRIAGIDGGDSGTLNMSGGTIVCYTTGSAPLGSTGTTLQPITFCAAAATYTAAAQSILNFSGGTIGAKGLIFGNPSGHYTANPICQFTMTGGLLYLDSLGIALSNGLSPSSFTSPVLTISGGTIAATANWTGSMSMTLDTTNGNITFQTADVNESPWNITLSGGLTGPGGLNETGGGILTLSGADSYSGSTIISNGEFAVATTAAGTSIGPVAIASGATLSTDLSAADQTWTNAGLIVASNSIIDFNFAGVLLSSSQPVIEANGNLTLDSSDSVTIEGSALLNGTYPLIACTGTLALTGGSTLPAITSVPSGVSATLHKSGNTIDLVISSSGNNFIKWGPLSAGTWDFTTANWINVGSGTAADYTDGIAVDLNDDGNSAVTINLATNVSPASITANNTTNGTVYYTITGPGAIGGASGITLQGSGGLALATPNTYAGGTIVNAGTLAINLGGDGVTESAIGTGPLTINAGALDNTSGSNVVLKYPTQQYWNGNFSYIGSQTNLDLGTGPVTLGSSSVQVTVLSNTLSYDGIITDNGTQYGLTVQGPGALSLNGLNNYTGATSLNSGKLNINNGGDGGPDSAIGTGTFVINGGIIDNTTGTNVQLQPSIPEIWNANFTFAGSGNLDLGVGPITTSALTLTLQNGATLSTEGQMIAAGGGGLATLTLAGNGAFQTSGFGNNIAGTAGLQITVNSGSLLLMDKDSPGVRSALALTVNTGGTARVTGAGGDQVGTSTDGGITLAGGTLDLFGSPDETTYEFTFNSGALENSSTNPAVLSLVTSMDLTGVACDFDVVSNSSLTIPNYIYGPGSLVKLDGGTLNLTSTNSYTGSTTVSNGLLSIITATTAVGDYTVAGGELEAFLDPTGVTLQVDVSSLTFGPDTRVGFDLASGGFGDTASSVIASGFLTMDGDVAVDVTNAPLDNNNDVLLSYSGRSGVGAFVAGHIPAGAYIYDNTVLQEVILTYTQPPSLSKVSFAGGSVSVSGGVVNSITFSGTNGTPSDFYEILSSTNLALRPLSAWTEVQEGNFDGAGGFNVTLSPDPTAAQTFYLLYTP
ncbi:MAG TPA: autotransporter-associated beta strand repeat-containing protein [Verrucomicrobiae bacterium]|jgi:autotransporter-associated beta strand protein|nr:autotransporter-associated beta strand repeat-containing protein [Verrucomicrobiae bacterium]